MHMKIASLLIAAQVAGAQQLHSAPDRQLRRDANAGGKKRKSSKNPKNPKNPTPLELRFGPQLSPEKVAKTFDKLTGVPIVSRGLQNFDTPDFSTPRVDYFSTGGVLAISYEEVESVCVTKCYNNPACKVVRVSDCGCDEFEEDKQGYNCEFYNPDLGPGAYFAKDFKTASNTVVYTKKAGNTVIPSHDEVACGISASTVEADIINFYGCFPDGDANSNTPTCIAGLGLTNDFFEYIVPATKCVLDRGDNPAAAEVLLFNCLTCLTNGLYRGAAAGICTADDETNYIRGTCGDVCYKVPRSFIDVNNNNTLVFSTVDLSACEPAIQAGMLCYHGSPLVGGVNRSNNTTPFACPE